jgi:hypothetical protein
MIEKQSRSIADEDGEYVYRAFSCNRASNDCRNASNVNVSHVIILFYFINEIKNQFLHFLVLIDVAFRTAVKIAVTSIRFWETTSGDGTEDFKQKIKLFININV